MKKVPMFNLTVCALAVLGGVLAYGASGARTIAHADGSSAPQVTTITVTGNSTENVAPDSVVVNAGVTETAKTAEAVQTDLNTVIHNDLGTLAGLSIPASDVQTSNYDLQPNYSQPGKSGQQTLTGFTATENLTIQLTDLTQTGKLIDTLVKLGTNQINGVNYQVSNSSQAEAQADVDALKDARNQANSIAQSLGVVITGVQSVNTSSGGSGPIYPMTHFDAESSSSTSTALSPGTEQITASATVVYTVANTATN